MVVLDGNFAVGCGAGTDCVGWEKASTHNVLHNTVGYATTNECYNERML